MPILLHNCRVTKELQEIVESKGIKESQWVINLQVLARLTFASLLAHALYISVLVFLCPHRDLRVELDHRVYKEKLDVPDQLVMKDVREWMDWK